MTDTSRRGFFAALVGRRAAAVDQSAVVSESGRRADVRRAGQFTIDPRLCLAHRGVGCSSCRERCPERGAIVVELGRPTISAPSCSGCGECLRVCPAPVLAIRLVAPTAAAII